jgi:polyisoprenoid-binding protein YceI
MSRFPGAGLFAAGLVGLVSVVGVVAQDASKPAPPKPTPVAVVDGKATLAPANTSIGFVGAHLGEKPDPHAGGFEAFAGSLGVDTAAKALTSAAVEIETGSLWTEIGNLTTHLKSPDFFDVKQHPKATFQSTAIAPGAKAGEVSITGDFTLLGVTKPITFPAKVSISDAGVTLEATFAIDRTAFGMNYGVDKVDRNVAVSLAVGRKTQVAKPAPPAGAGK